MTDEEMAMFYAETQPKGYGQFLERTKRTHCLSSAMAYRNHMLAKACKKPKRVKSPETTKAGKYFNAHKSVWVVGTNKGRK